jgi:hypothetical protein
MLRKKQLGKAVMIYSAMASVFQTDDVISALP